MKITIEAVELKKAIKRANTIKVKGQHLPILQHIKFDALQSLTLCKTDLDSTVVITCRNARIDCPGSALIPEKWITNIVKKMAGTISIEAKAETKTWQEPIASEDHDQSDYDAECEYLFFQRIFLHYDYVTKSETVRTLILTNNNIEYTTKLEYSMSDYPVVPFETVELRDLDEKGFSQAVRQVIYSTSKDEVRYNQNCVCFEPYSDDVIRLIATDSHRLSVSHAVIPLKSERQVLIHKDALKVVLALLEPNMKIGRFVSKDRQNTFFVSSNTMIIVRELDYDFPDYKVGFPDATKHEMTLTREQIEPAILQAMTTNDSKHVVFVLNENGLLITDSHIPENQTIKASFPDVHNGSAETFSMDGNLFLDALNACDGQALVRWNDAQSAFVFVRNGQDTDVNLAMPVRL